MSEDTRKRICLRIRWTILAFLGATSFPAAGEKVALKPLTWKVGEVTREALVYAPPANGLKRPVVFAFHGHGGKGAFAARQFAIHERWPEAICVYPNGLPTAVPIIDPQGKFSGWQKFAGDQGDRDLLFFDAMLKTLIADHGGDAKRVYVAGHSNGGYFAYTLAAARGEKLAALAPVAGAATLRDFKNQKPLPILHIAGEKDKIVKFAVQESTIEKVRRLNGCDAEGKPAGKHCTEYASKSGAPVVAFVHPGGHEVPAGAGERIVEFFKSHPRVATPNKN